MTKTEVREQFKMKARQLNRMVQCQECGREVRAKNLRRHMDHHYWEPGHPGNIYSETF